MYSNVWAKYLPIIRIVLKRSLASEQVLALNVEDFEKAGMKRKSGYKFLLKLKNGKPENILTDTPLGSSLVTTMLEDEATRAIIASRAFHINLNPKFKLTITHIPEASTVA